MFVAWDGCSRKKFFIMRKLWFDLQLGRKKQDKGSTNIHRCKWEKGWPRKCWKNVCMVLGEKIERKKNQLFWAMQSNFHQFHEPAHSFWVLHLLQGTMVLFWHWPCHNKELFPWPHQFLTETPMIRERTKQWDFETFSSGEGVIKLVSSETGGPSELLDKTLY